MTLHQESIYVEHNQHALHMRHIWQQRKGCPVLMLHGVIENGKIFYTLSGKGFGCYLAEQGFDVYVADYRGRGASKPTIDHNSDHGQHQIIVEDIPAMIRFLYDHTQQPIHVVCHSWGGVMLASSLVRFPELRPLIRSLVCFGTKRQVLVKTFESIWKVHLLWKYLAPMLAKRKGYLDAVGLKLGADNETTQAVIDNTLWVKRSAWRDTIDEFDYAKAAVEFDWPPTWHLTGVKDHALGHAKDVQTFINECQNHKAKFTLLAKTDGAMHDYDHIDILTHKDAVKDHFPQIAQWLKDHSN